MTYFFVQNAYFSRCAGTRAQSLHYAAKAALCDIKNEKKLQKMQKIFARTKFLHYLCNRKTERKNKEIYVTKNGRVL